MAPFTRQILEYMYCTLYLSQYHADWKGKFLVYCSYNQKIDHYQAVCICNVSFHLETHSEILCCGYFWLLDYCSQIFFFSYLLSLTYFFFLKAIYVFYIISPCLFYSNPSYLHAKPSWSVHFTHFNSTILIPHFFQNIFYKYFNLCSYFIFCQQYA